MRNDQDLWSWVTRGGKRESTVKCQRNGRAGLPQRFGNIQHEYVSVCLGFLFQKSWLGSLDLLWPWAISSPLPPFTVNAIPLILTVLSRSIFAAWRENGSPFSSHYFLLGRYDMKPGQPGSTCQKSTCRGSE